MRRHLRVPLVAMQVARASGAQYEEILCAAYDLVGGRRAPLLAREAELGQVLALAFAAGRGLRPQERDLAHDLCRVALALAEGDLAELRPTARPPAPTAGTARHTDVAVARAFRPRRRRK